MDLQQLYTDLILEYNRDKTNKSKNEYDATVFCQDK